MTEKPPVDYRTRIYAHYAKDFQCAGSEFNFVAAEKWGRAYRWYLRNWLPSNHDAVIAELGCGWGRLLQLFVGNGYTNVSGVDLSPDQVQLARKISPSVDEGNALQLLAQKEGHFDLIVALDLIEHLTKAEALTMLDLCFAALKPGGRFILQTPNADSPFGSQHRYGDFTHEFGLTPSLLTFLLGQAGFQTVQAREQGPVPIGYSVSSSVRFLLWRVLRSGITAWNLIETGSSGEVLTRVFMCSAVKPNRCDV